MSSCPISSSIGTGQRQIILALRFSINLRAKPAPRNRSPVEGKADCSQAAGAAIAVLERVDGEKFEGEIADADQRMLTWRHPPKRATRQVRAFPSA